MIGRSVRRVNGRDRFTIFAISDRATALTRNAAAQEPVIVPPAPVDVAIPRNPSYRRRVADALGAD
jgi:hypothetical protein